MTRFRRDYISAGAASLVQRSDLASSGFIPNDSKSHSDPGKWLEFFINTFQSTFQIPETKPVKEKRSLESLIIDGCATYQELARLAGFIISLSV